MLAEYFHVHFRCCDRQNRISKISPTNISNRPSHMFCAKRPLQQQCRTIDGICVLPVRYVPEAISGIRGPGCGSPDGVGIKSGTVINCIRNEPSAIMKTCPSSGIFMIKWGWKRHDECGGTGQMAIRKLG